MEVSGRYARTRAITRDTHSPANRAVRRTEDASRGVACVVSDVSVLCPWTVDEADNSSRDVMHLTLLKSTGAVAATAPVSDSLVRHQSGDAPEHIPRQRLCHLVRAKVAVAEVVDRRHGK